MFRKFSGWSQPAGLQGLRNTRNGIYKIENNSILLMRKQQVLANIPFPCKDRPDWITPIDQRLSAGGV